MPSSFLLETFMSKTVVATKAAPAAIGPYSQAIHAGFAVFVSGQIPINPATGTMPESVEDQARQALENVKAVLEAAGSSLDKVVKTTCFLTNMGDFAAFNGIYAQFFTKDAPARSAVAVVSLPKGAKLEVEAIALP